MEPLRLASRMEPSKKVPVTGILFNCRSAPTFCGHCKGSVVHDTVGNPAMQTSPPFGGALCSDIATDPGRVRGAEIVSQSRCNPHRFGRS